MTTTVSNGDFNMTKECIGDKTLVLFCLYRAGTEIVSKAARDRVEFYLNSLKQHFAGKLIIYSLLHDKWVKTGHFGPIFIPIHTFLVSLFTNKHGHARASC